MGLGSLVKATILTAGIVLSSQKSFDNYITLQNPPLESYVAFNHISKDYIPYLHDCDDMVQEFRDYLINKCSVSINDLRLITVKNKKNGINHAYLLWRRQNQWRLFDPAQRIFDARRNHHDEEYNLIEELPGDEIIRDTGGYSCRGDKFIDGKWDSVLNKGYQRKINDLLEDEKTKDLTIFFFEFLRNYKPKGE